MRAFLTCIHVYRMRSQLSVIGIQMLPVFWIFPLHVNRLVQGHFWKRFPLVLELALVGLILLWLLLIIILKGRRLSSRLLRPEIVQVSTVHWQRRVVPRILENVWALVWFIEALHLDVRVLDRLLVLFLAGVPLQWFFIISIIEVHSVLGVILRLLLNKLKIIVPQRPLWARSRS